ncbi:MAG: amidohydrolase [Thermoplasmatota archaeon]|nr:amidohydrolase [Candidatus Thermoplasmatota archaeon]MBU1913620.1 amidohydrolase [Candidatus Thermoplasmatota archaeon]
MAGSASLAIRNASVYTVDRTQMWAEAVAVEGDRIVFVGSDQDLEAYLGEDTEVIDAKGRLALPGFIDSHLHLSMGDMDMTWVQLGSIKSREEVYGLLSKHASEHPKRELVGGIGWRYEALLVDGKLPTKRELDEVVADRHLLLQSFDGWVCLANSKLTDLIDRELTNRPPAPGVERDPRTQEATGVFLDSSVVHNLGGEVSRLVRGDVMGGIREAVARAPSYGITSVHDAYVAIDDLPLFRRLKEDGMLKARVYCALGYRKEMTAKDLDQFECAREDHKDEWVNAGAVKLFIDGVLESHTAAMLEPYADRPDSRGELKYEPDEFREIVRELDRRGFQLVTHACGDRGVRTVLDAYEYAALANGRRDSRHRVEHVETMSHADIPRFEKLGAIASMQPEHADASMDSVCARVLGRERFLNSFPWRKIRQSGAVLSFSSDWSVASMDPLGGIYAAMTRESVSKSERTVTLDDAIEAYTINGAYASFEEGIKGSIEVGKLADMVMLSQNLFNIPVNEIPRVRPVMTILGGKIVFHQEDQ